MPVVGRFSLGNQPRLVNSFHHIRRQWSFLEVVQVSVQLLEARDANDDTVVTAILDVECTVVHRPTQGRFNKAQALVLANGLLNGAQRLESAVFKVAASVCVAGGVLVAEAALELLRINVLALDLATEQTTGNRVIHDNVEAIAMARRHQLRVDAARDHVVHGLVYSRTNPAVLAGNHDGFGHLESCVVGQAELDELAGLVQLVKSTESLLKGRRAVGGMNV